MLPGKEFETPMQALPCDKNKAGGKRTKTKYSDGTNRKAKPVQIKTLDFMEENKDRHIKVLMGPTGVGKSFVALAMAKKGTVIVVSDNVQLDQYAERYPEVNILRGKAHYAHDIDYLEAKERLWAGDVTITNIHAWVTFRKYGSRSMYEEYGPRFETRLIIIDEFHRLEGALIGMESGTFIKKSYPGLPLTDNVVQLVDFFRSILSVLRSNLENNTMTLEDEEKLQNEIYKFEGVVYGLDGSSSDYVIDPQKDRVVVTRYEPSQDILRLFKEVPRVVLMTATPRPFDIAYFTSAPARFDAPSDIPRKQREIKYVSTPLTMTWKTKVEDVVPHIDKILENHKGQNGVIHVPYHRQEAFEEHYPNFLYHNTANKAQVLAYFKENGGIFVASGCAEGIDFMDDECRFQIIPWMLKPSLGDLWVKSRRAKKGGQTWYDWEVLTTFAQMAGRSTRGPTDWSTVYTFDVTLYKLYTRYKRELWPWFKQALVLYSRN